MNSDTPDGCIRTLSGRLVDPFKLDPRDIMLGDVASGLAKTCRFGGQIEQFYCVAQHSVFLTRVVRKLKPGDWVAAALGWVHDGWEAYFTDMKSPLKHKLLIQDFDGCYRTVKTIEDRELGTIIRALFPRSVWDAYHAGTHAQFITQLDHGAIYENELSLLRGDKRAPLLLETLGSGRCWEWWLAETELVKEYRLILEGLTGGAYNAPAFVRAGPHAGASGDLATFGSAAPLGALAPAVPARTAALADRPVTVDEIVDLANMLPAEGMPRSGQQLATNSDARRQWWEDLHGEGGVA